MSRWDEKMGAFMDAWQTAGVHLHARAAQHALNENIVYEWTRTECDLYLIFLVCGCGRALGFVSFLFALSLKLWIQFCDKWQWSFTLSQDFRTMWNV